ncbi:SDR family oxidoreductase [Streptomyces sp. NPDC005786]|uniref:SDR family oxidoreductase n=1 Tax=Streptomyces sp. NPDC005786 TaxID=3154891 RepID=UPI0033E3CBBD
MKRVEGKVALPPTAGLAGALTNRRTAHPASEDAVIALIRQLAAEGAAHGIRARRVSPGLIHTAGSRAGLLADGHPVRGLASHTPPGQLSVPGDVVRAAVLLASDEAGYATGARPGVDGGWSAVLPGAST